MEKQPLKQSVVEKVQESIGIVVPKIKFVYDNLEAAFSVLKNDRLGQIGLVILTIFLFMAIFAPYLAPHDPMERNLDSALESPSEEHPLGTTIVGRDVLSQLIFGTRTVLIVGLAAGLTSVTIGTAVGITSAYIGGYADDILMRLTDVAYGIPFLPFAIALVFLLGPSLQNIVIAISVIMWRSTARVVRSQTLTLKERPYIESAEASGAGRIRIMTHHLFPNVFPIVVLYMAMTVGWSIIAEANLAFLGFGDPMRISWGSMIFGTYSQNVIRTAWWWVIPPGICIMLLVMSIFFVGRALEETINPELREQ